MVAPYMKSLCTMVADYIEHEGFEVVDRIALEIPDNLEVGRRDPLALVEIYKRLKLDGVDVLVLSSCVQMPSLAAVPIVEQECGLPVVSASVCTTYQMLQRLGLQDRRTKRRRVAVRTILTRLLCEVLERVLSGLAILADVDRRVHGACRRRRRSTSRASGRRVSGRTSPSAFPGPSSAITSASRSTTPRGCAATAWDASIQTLPEWQCRPHSADYIWRGPSNLRISKEVDPVSREITAFHAEWLRSVDRAIYLDGRPHPPEDALHTWAGFSTGEMGRRHADRHGHAPEGRAICAATACRAATRRR